MNTSVLHTDILNCVPIKRTTGNLFQPPLPRARSVTAASYYSTTLKFSELFKATHSFINVCKSTLHGFVLDFYTALAMGLKTPNFED